MFCVKPEHRAVVSLKIGFFGEPDDIHISNSIEKGNMHESSLKRCRMLANSEHSKTRTSFEKFGLNRNAENHTAQVITIIFLTIK